MIYSLYYLILFVVLFCIELVYFRIADKCNIIDKPNQRSSHTSITLRGGGIIFYFGALLFFLISGFQYPFFMLGLTLIAGISFIDDIKPASRTSRLVIHFSSMLLMFYEWGLFTEFPLWYILIALVVCTGIINAFNFIDGINGITGGSSVVTLVTLLFVNYRTEYFVADNLLITVLLAVLVFNIFNFRTKAKCFAGDVGAVAIAFIIIFCLGLLVLKTGDLTYMVLLAVYGVDTVLTIIHRLMLKENIFDAHRKHAYQILGNELKWKHVHVSVFYMALQGGINIGFLLMNPTYRWCYFGSVLLLLVTAYILFMKRYFKLHLK